MTGFLTGRVGPLLAGLLLSGVAMAATAGGARAEVAIDVDLTTQTMHVTAAGGSRDWSVSTARTGFVTPRGDYGVERMEAMHYSHEYHNSPMPHSIFFRGGYAIHGTNATSSLGAAASHGCVRLSPAHAAALYSMVQAEGASIHIHGVPPAHRAPAELTEASVDGDEAIDPRPRRRAAAYVDDGEAAYADVAPRPRRRASARPPSDNVQYYPSFVPGPDGAY